jgi:iron(III) transport system substrate-binding protein
VLDDVIAGEYSIALNMFSTHAVISARKGAPVAWIPMQPATGVLSPIAITRQAPHPNAGKLLIEYLMSEEGQQVFRDQDYIPVNPNVPARDPGLRDEAAKLRTRYFTPEKIDASMGHWADVFNRLFR